jgi:amino acid permease
MFGVMLFLFMICLFVCIVVNRSEEPKAQLGEVTRVAPKRQVVSLITLFDIIIFTFMYSPNALLG